MHNKATFLWNKWHKSVKFTAICPGLKSADAHEHVWMWVMSAPVLSVAVSASAPAAAHCLTERNFSFPWVFACWMTKSILLNREKEALYCQLEHERRGNNCSSLIYFFGLVGPRCECLIDLWCRISTASIPPGLVLVFISPLWSCEVCEWVSVHQPFTLFPFLKWI